MPLKSISRSCFRGVSPRDTPKKAWKSQPYGDLTSVNGGGLATIVASYGPAMMVEEGGSGIRQESGKSR